MGAINQARRQFDTPHSPTPSPEEEGEQAARTLAYYLGLTPALNRLLLTGQSIAPLEG